MVTLEGQKAVVTGGSRGLGLGIVEALVAQKARVTVVARDPERLAEVSKRLGVNVARGDVTDEKLARGVLSDVRPSVLVLNAGATPPMGPLHELTWENFSRAWDVDVKAGFHWVQATLRLPLPRGSRVIIASSGAALNGSQLRRRQADAVAHGALRERCGPAARSRHPFSGDRPPADHRRHRARAQSGRGLREEQGRQPRSLPRRFRRADAAAQGRRQRRVDPHRSALRDGRGVRHEGRPRHRLARRLNGDVRTCIVTARG
jgi:hypothetical protein